MSVFSLNVSETLNSVASSKKSVKDYEEDLNLYLNSTLNIDSAWNDNNTQGFIDIVKAEKNEFNEQIYLLNLNLSTIENFCQSLKNLVYSNFGLNLVNIEYTLEKIDVLISYLNECYNRLNQNYYLFNSMRVSPTFKYYFVLQKYKKETLTYRNNVYSLKNRLVIFKNAVEGLIYNTRTKINNIGVKSVSSLILDHTYQVSSNNLIRQETKVDK